MRHIIPIAVLLFVGMDTAAQMNNIVDVENSYIPVIRDANKINLQPENTETPVKHYNVEYAKESLPVRGYVFQPVWAAQSDVAAKGADKGFVSLGGGNSGNVQARAMYGIDFTDNDLLNIGLSFQGHNGNVDKGYDYVPDMKWKSRFYTTRASVGYEHRLLKNSSIMVDAAFESQVFNYNQEFGSGGSGVSSCDKQHNSIGDLSARLTPYMFGNVSVGGELKYQFFKQKYATSFENECNEGIFSGRVDLAYELDEGKKLELGVMLRTAIYDMKYTDFMSLDGREFKSNTSFHLVPAYDMRYDDFDLHIGLQLCGISGVQSRFRVAPDIRFNYHIDEKMDVYAEATGGEVYNDFRRFSQMTPYWSFLDASTVNKGTSLQLPNQFNQLCATGGLRFELLKGLYADINAGYDISKNRAELAGGFSFGSSADRNIVTPVFASDGNRLRLNLDVRYDYKDVVSVDMKNRFNNWESVASPYSGEKMDICWRPVIDLDWTASLKVVSGLQIGVGYILQTFKKPDSKWGYDGRPTISNLCADISYTFPVGFSLFVRGDNLLDNDYENYWEYRALGANVLAGFAFTF